MLKQPCRQGRRARLIRLLRPRAIGETPKTCRHILRRIRKSITAGCKKEIAEISIVEKETANFEVQALYHRFTLRLSLLIGDYEIAQNINQLILLVLLSYEAVAFAEDHFIPITVVFDHWSKL